MNWVEFAYARQNIAEREIGKVYREIEAQEDAIAAQTRKALGG
jgi:hypothetical protein